MADNRKNPERIIYDEKPACGRCGNTIIGVVSRIRDGKPLCRDCIFELDQLMRKPGGRIVVEEEKLPLTREEKIQRAVILGSLGLIVIFFLWRVFAIAPLLKPAQPLRTGTYETDAVTDRCIRQLWVLSKQLQENRLPESFPPCPMSGRSYTLVQEEDDIVIRCPTPEEHGLTSLSVSLNSPVPLAVSGEER